MIEKISDFIYSFKNKIVEAKDIASKYDSTISEFVQAIKKESLDEELKENFYTILGYTYRLDDISQRLFFTFQEAVYATDLDKLMKNDESLRVNSIVYILVLDEIIKEYNTKEINLEQKNKALEIYKKIEERKASENKKYHMYQN